VGVGVVASIAGGLVWLGDGFTGIELMQTAGRSSVVASQSVGVVFSPLRPGPATRSCCAGCTPPRARARHLETSRAAPLKTRDNTGAKRLKDNVLRYGGRVAIRTLFG
jgi:hypothetical protein